jgi:hypothetical protein
MDCGSPLPLFDVMEHGFDDYLSRCRNERESKGARGLAQSMTWRRDLNSEHLMWQGNDQVSASFVPFIIFC